MAKSYRFSMPQLLAKLLLTYSANRKQEPTIKPRPAGNKENFKKKSRFTVSHASGFHY
jgi:hypothetical protein